MDFRAARLFRFPSVRLLASLFLFLAAALVLRADIVPIALKGQPDPRRDPYSDGLLPLGLSKGGSIIFQEYFQFGALYRHTPGLRDGITDNQTVGPDGAHFQSFFDRVDVNSRGDGSLTVDTDLGRRTYLVTTKGFFYLAYEGEQVTGDGFIAVNGGLDSKPSLSAKGEIGFHAGTTQSGQAILLLTPKPGAVFPQLITKLGASSLDGGHFTNLDLDVCVTAPASGPTLVAFTGETNGTAGSGLYLGTPTGISLVTKGRPAYRLNNEGKVVWIEGNLFLGSSAGSAPFIRVNDPAPGGTFTDFAQAGINDRGDIAFVAGVDDGFGNISTGIYVRLADGTYRTVALSVAPGGGAFQQSKFSDVEINNAGLVKFLAPVDIGGQTQYGMFLGDGVDLVKVAQTGDLLLGSPIAGEIYYRFDYGTIPAPVPQLPGHGSFNELGQIAFRGHLSTDVSGIFLYTPSGHWRTAGTGLWDLPANWTFGLAPSPIADSAIDFDSDAVVTGPAANATVRSLQIGGGLGKSTLVLKPGVRLTATKGINLLDNGTIAGSGTLVGAVNLNPRGTIALELRGKQRGAEYDFLSFASPVKFGGILNVTAPGAFAPKLGDVFDLLDFRVHSGLFQRVMLPPLPSAALLWDETKLTTTGQISVVLAPALRGVYAGRITGATSAESALFSATIGANGSVKGKGTIGGKPFSFAGALDDSGAFTSAAVDKAGHVVTLQVDFNNLATGSLTGTLKDAAQASVATFAAQQTPTFTAKVPSPIAGSYTIALPADPLHPEATYPQGTGYAVVTVSVAGRATVVGTLGDGTKFSFGGQTSAQRELALYVPLYGRKGCLFGQIAFTAPGAANDVLGSLRWYKPDTNTPKWYPATFTGDIAIMGSGFEKPPIHPKILDFPNGGAFTITGGNVPALPAEDLAIDLAHRNAVTFTPAGPTAVFAGSLFTGKFPSTIATKAVKVSFMGIVLQKQNTAVGYFKGDGVSGSFKVVAK